MTPETVLLTPEFLRSWPLPQPGEEDDKEGRGRVLVVGGTREMPGAIMLAAIAALRAGAGKLRIATCASLATQVGVAVPEARVFALPETETGEISPEAAGKIAGLAKQVNAVLVGPGMIGSDATTSLIKKLLPLLDTPALVLDAGAFLCLSEAPDLLGHLKGQAVITPHAGEMAHLMGLAKEKISSDRANLAVQAAERFGVVVSLKGPETYIAAPGSKVYINRTGNVGLATSGSGDVLAGIIAGLAARGAEPARAAAWASYLQGRAGEVLAWKTGRLGFLAREIPGEIPLLMQELANPSQN